MKIKINYTNYKKIIKIYLNMIIKKEIINLKKLFYYYA